MAKKITRRQRRENAKTIVKAMSVMKVDNGDVVMIKVNSRAHEVMNDIAKVFGATGKQDCLLVVVGSFDEMKTISKDSMGQYGWYRNEETEASKPEVS